MQCTQPIVVALDGEVRQKPDHLAQKVDDGTDVEEFHPQPLHLQVDDLEAGVGDAGAHNLRVLIGPVVFSRPEEMLAQVPQRGRSDVLGEVTAASPENPGNLGPPSGAGWRLVTRSNAASAKGSGGLSPVMTTTAPSGCSRLVAIAALGGHASVATMVGGKLPAPASTSPPPVSRSKAAVAFASR